MTMIEALLSLPGLGKPALVDGNVAAALRRCPTRFARCLGKAWFLTDSGRNFLAQFSGGSSVAPAAATVRLVAQRDAEPQFELLLDDGTSSLLQRAELKRRLQEMRTANPEVTISYDFRPAARAP